MIARELISESILPLKTSETGDEALSTMTDFNVRHLPIVNNEKLLGLISEDDILQHDTAEPIGSYALTLQRPYVYLDDHIFDVMARLDELRLTVIPVIDREENYLGIITLEDLLHYFAGSFSFQEPGSILVLEMSRIDYSLAEIARIVESDDASILSVFISSVPDSTRIYITLKINRQYPDTIISSFRRYEYQVTGYFTEEEYVDVLKERYDMLMKYLDV